MDSHKVAVAEGILTALSNPQNEDPGDSVKQLDIMESGNTIAESTIKKDEHFAANVDIKITEATVGIEVIEGTEAITKVTEDTEVNEVTEEIEVAKLTQDTETTKLTENAKASAATEDTKVTEVTEYTEVTNAAIITTETTILPTLIEISDIADKADSSVAYVASTVKIEEIGDDILDNVSNNEIKNIATEIINTANEAAFTDTNMKSTIEISGESTNEIHLESNSISKSSEFNMHAVVGGVESNAVNEATETRTEIETNFAAIVSSLNPEEIQEGVENGKTLSTEVGLESSDDSASQSGTDHASGNDYIDLSDSDSSNKNYRNTRRTPPQQSGDDVSSTDGDNCEAIRDNGNEEQEQVHIGQHHVEPVDPKESLQPPRKVDDDEDKNNPQYIPKRGTFYEHDYRTTDDVADGEKGDNEKEKTEGDGKKKVWHDKQEKWSHDKFKNDDQTPKSRDELIAIYGYDIRNEDGPPRARRRRRYGRGPNKYTRNWEDEDAYYKNSSKKPTQQVKGIDDQSHQQQEHPKQQETSTRQIRDNPRPGSKFLKDVPQERDHVYSQDARGGLPKVQSAGTGRVMQTNRDYIKADYKSFTKARNYNRSEQRVPQQHQQRFRNEGGNSGGGDNLRQHRQHTSPDRRYQRHTNDNRDANVKQMNKSMASLSLQQQFDGDANQQPPPERKVVSKRYSAMRQRPFPDANIITLSEAFVAQQKLNAEIEHREHERMVVQQQQQQQQHFYEQQQSPTGQVNVAMCAPPQLGLPPRQCLTDTALAQQLAAAGRQIHPQQPQRFVGGVPPLQPTPSQFISPPPPQFLTRPPQPPPINLNYQLAPQHYYQHQQAPPQPQFVSQPMGAMQPQQVSTEQLFQPQGGITYYSPEDQQTTQRHAPPIRPKAAIPILPPPPTPTPMSNNSNSDS